MPLKLRQREKDNDKKHILIKGGPSDLGSKLLQKY